MHNVGAAAAFTSTSTTTTNTLDPNVVGLLLPPVDSFVCSPSSTLQNSLQCIRVCKTNENQFRIPFAKRRAQVSCPGPDFSPHSPACCTFTHHNACFYSYYAQIPTLKSGFGEGLQLIETAKPHSLGREEKLQCNYNNQKNDDIFKMVVAVLSVYSVLYV